MSYESLLNNSIRLRTRYSSQNELGEWTYSYSSSSTPTKCRLVPISAIERIDRTGLYDDVRYKCFCLSSSTIDRDSRVDYSGKIYRVKEVVIDSSHHHKTALLKEVI